MASQSAAVDVGRVEAAPGMNRREFLYYIWAASIALLTLEGLAALVWFLIPRFREGEFGGLFTLDVSAVPEANTGPVNFAEGRFWLVNVDGTNPNELFTQAPDEPAPIVGVAAIYKVCTHLGCIYDWTPGNDRFECPCHGSKYRLDGRRIETPAPRTLDRFLLQAVAEDKVTVLAESEVGSDDFYNPVILPPSTAFVRIDTGSRLDGPSQVPLCDFSGTCP